MTFNLRVSRCSLAINLTFSLSNLVSQLTVGGGRAAGLN